MDFEEFSGVVGEKEPVQEAAAPAETEPAGEEGVEAGAADQPKQATTDSEEIPDRVWGIARKRAQAEAKQRYDRMVEQQNAEIARRCAGRTIPGTDRPIRTVRDYFEALDVQEQMQMRAQLQKANLDPGLIERAVQQNPAIRQAQAVLEETRRNEAERELERQLKSVSELDPEIQTLGDLANMPTFAEFDRLFRSGLDMVSAYKAANFDVLAAKRSQAAKQAAINAAKGKEHLAPIGGGAEPAGSLSDTDLDVWKAYGFSSEEARKYHGRFQKK